MAPAASAAAGGDGAFHQAADRRRPLQHRAHLGYPVSLQHVLRPGGRSPNAISGVDLALWDLVGNALGMPVYKLLGGETKARIPTYCTGNDTEQHIQFGYHRLKLAVPYGPADGREGMRKNTDLVKHTRDMLGPDGDIMLDCWMALNEQYTIEFAEMVAPYRVYWMEECLPPHDFEGFGRLREAIKSTRIATGEHEYFRYGFRHCAGAQRGRHLAAGHPLVRRADRAAADCRPGLGL